jgi:hypothetical protein
MNPSLLRFNSPAQPNREHLSKEFLERLNVHDSVGLRTLTGQIRHGIVGAINAEFICVAEANKNVTHQISIQPVLNPQVITHSDTLDTLNEAPDETVNAKGLELVPYPQGLLETQRERPDNALYDVLVTCRTLGSATTKQVMDAIDSSAASGQARALRISVLKGFLSITDHQRSSERQYTITRRGLQEIARREELLQTLEHLHQIEILATTQAQR